MKIYITTCAGFPYKNYPESTRDFIDLEDPLDVPVPEGEGWELISTCAEHSYIYYTWEREA